jgi:hypothetical protein
VTDTPHPGGQSPQAVNLEVTVPEALSAGVYANGFGTWFNQTDFTLDGFVHLPADQRTDEHGAGYIHQPVQVVVRVKFPPSLIFSLIQNLEQAMTNYEAQFGAITSLGPTVPPPTGNVA